MAPGHRQLEAFVGDACGVAVLRCTPLSGGDVARAFRCDLADGRCVFAKTHDDLPLGFFTTEALGLAWLRFPDDNPISAGVAVPEVIAASDDPPALVLEWIDEGGRPSTAGEAAFGEALARLHQVGANTFGRTDRRTTGSRGLPNEPCDSWPEFFASQRLLPLAQLARDGRALPDAMITALESVAGRLNELGGPPEPPARLHGDLWAGNRMVDTGGQSWLIDPATHGGHREFDLAMMRLFGGFGDAAFEAYASVVPLAAGWQELVPLHQLAPLVVHAIKFGGGYVGAVDDALSRCR